MTDNSEDFELVNKFLNGDEIAFNRIVNKYSKKIYWHARRMTGNHFDADEIVQEVLMVLYRKLGQFKFNSSLYTYIYKITVTRSLNFIKKEKLKSLFFLDSKPNSVKNFEADIISGILNKEKLERLDKQLQKLPAKQREVFILRHFEEMSYEEIAEITGKSIGGLKANYFHALNKITALMSHD
ncbi:MAG TPA: RNA polymerase sigma factor [Ignavibacteriaceae bacterium]|mgnify:CR=1 FL=1|nr:RNA polymerase sigma factor [Ignavibacteriaceae bacterium]